MTAGLLLGLKVRGSVYVYRDEDRGNHCISMAERGRKFYKPQGHSKMTYLGPVQRAQQPAPRVVRRGDGALVLAARRPQRLQLRI